MSEMTILQFMSDCPFLTFFLVVVIFGSLADIIRSICHRNSCCQCEDCVNYEEEI